MPEITDYVNDPSRDYSMAPLFVCDVCRAEVYLFTRLLGKLVCGECWHRAGSPFPRTPSTAEELHRAELATRERMQKRGGADRHMVRNGKS